MDLKREEKGRTVYFEECADWCSF